MYYFTYMTKLKNSLKYYVGRHSTLNLEDGYKGSGKWIRSIKDKNLLYTNILCFYSTEKELIEAEKQLLSQHVKNLDCMNFNENPVGFSGLNNPNKTPEARERNRQRMLGISNPMYGKLHSEEAKLKISKSTVGSSNGMYGKKHSDECKKRMREAKIGKKQSKDHIEKLRNIRIGKDKPEYLTFLGREHKPETKEKQRQAKLGKKLSEEAKAKIGKANSGRVVSEATKQKMREAAFVRRYFVKLAMQK